MAVIDPAQPKVPDGGAVAWIQVLGSFLLYMNTWGLLSSYGSFQTYYETQLLLSRTSFQISVIGSLQNFLLVFLGLFIGPLYDAGYFRHILTCGTVLVLGGTLSQSFCYDLWQLVVSQGLCIGVGGGCLSILCVAIPSSWFTTRLPLANGLAASGSGVGGVLYPVVIRQLIPLVGFGWTVRTMALIMAVTLGGANILLRNSHSTKKPRKLVDVASITDWPYVTFVVGSFLVFLGLYTPWFYVQSYALASVQINPDIALYIVMAMNIAGIPGRILPTLVAPRIGAMNLIITSTIALSATCLGLLGANSTISVFAVAIIYGFFTGSFFGLQPTIFVRLTDDMSVIGTRFGMAFAVLSVALLFGTPIGGQLHDAYSYGASWAWSAATLLCGGACIGFSRVLKARSSFIF